MSGEDRQLLQGGAGLFFSFGFALVGWLYGFQAVVTAMFTAGTVVGGLMLFAWFVKMP